jgi:hypothetical protein
LICLAFLGLHFLKEFAKSCVIRSIDHCIKGSLIASE